MVVNPIRELLYNRLKNNRFLIEDGYRKTGDRSLRPAAVLLPLIDHHAGCTVLLTKRTDHLFHHPGQISFPGGGFEDQDKGDPVCCALRETHEEIGLAADRVEVLGMLEPWRTGTGFMILPVVGWITPPLALTPDSFEVAAILEPSLDWLTDRSHQQRITRTEQGKSRDFWAISWQDHTIWGATAGLLVALTAALEP